MMDNRPKSTISSRLPNLYEKLERLNRIIKSIEDGDDFSVQMTVSAFMTQSFSDYIALKTIFDREKTTQILNYLKEELESDIDEILHTLKEDE